MVFMSPTFNWSGADGEYRLDTPHGYRVKRLGPRQWAVVLEGNPPDTLRVPYETLGAAKWAVEQWLLEQRKQEHERILATPAGTLAKAIDALVRARIQEVEAAEHFMHDEVSEEALENLARALSEKGGAITVLIAPTVSTMDQGKSL